MKRIKNKKLRILVLIFLVLIALELVFFIARNSYSTCAETENGRIQIFATAEVFTYCDYVWCYLSGNNKELKKIKNLKINIYNETSGELVYTLPGFDSSHKPNIEKPNLDQLILMGLSFRKNLIPIYMVDNPSYHYSIVQISEEHWKYQVEYEFDGKIVKEELKPKRGFRIPDDTLLEILFSYLI